MRLRQAPYIPIRDDSNVISTNEEDFVRLSLSHHFRTDGRALTQMRPARIQLTRSSTNGETGCSVQWGSAVTVNCHCQGVIVPPSADRPNEGSIKIAVDLSPMASTGFKYGQAVTNGGGGGGMKTLGSSAAGGSGALDDNQKLQANRILRCLENLIGNCLDAEALVVIPGQWVWQLQVRVTSWDCSNHNILDASVLATLAALRHYRQPSTSTEGAPSDLASASNYATPTIRTPQTISLDQKEGTPLPLHHTPLSISFAWLEKEESKNSSTPESSMLTDPKHDDSMDDIILIVDPTWQEQRVCLGNEVVLNLSIYGEVCGMVSSGAVTPSLLRQCHKLATSLVPQLSESLETTLKKANEQAVEESLKRIRRQQQQQQESGTMNNDETMQVDNDDTTAGGQALQAAEESYRKQALEYNLGHQAVQVKEDGNQRAKASSSSSSRLLQSLLQAVSKQPSEKEEQLAKQRQNAKPIMSAETTQGEEPKKKQILDTSGVTVLKMKPTSSSDIRFEDTAPKPQPSSKKDSDDEEDETMQLKSEFSSVPNSPKNAMDLDSDDEEETTTKLQSEFSEPTSEADLVKEYNREQMEQEEEETFWEENRNTNRDASAGKKKSFGPDKIKGGRIPTAKPPPVDQDGKPTKAGAKKKARNMAKRKNQQKQAMQKRSGGD